MNKRFVFAASLVLACASIAFAQETKYPDILDAKLHHSDQNGVRLDKR